MKLYSTNDPSNIVDLKEAVLNAFPKDKGLYMPMSIPQLPATYYDSISDRSFNENAFIICQALMGNYIPMPDLETILLEAFDFPAPLVKIEENLHSLELFHGPSMAFKDFGARFMAKLMAYFLKEEDRKTTILVATSGDTGGAVAAGFYETEGIDVIILYPKGKVSELQEKQLTSWGKNIKAIEIDGVFDDCQALVKEAFLDKDLKSKYQFSSANSINIARLIPQSFYYHEAYKQLENKEGVCFAVPSGNFGNLCAGLIAKKMGLPVHKFIAATNSNKVVPDYLKSGKFDPKKTIQTLSNAMDVGNPSNFTRIMALYSSTWNNVKKDVVGYHYSDEETLKGIETLNKQHKYITDPHGAIAYLACKENQLKESLEYVFLETAHPGKFQNVVEKAISANIGLPSRLSSFLSKEKTAMAIDHSYKSLKTLLMGL